MSICIIAADKKYKKKKGEGSYALSHPFLLQEGY